MRANLILEMAAPSSTLLVALALIALLGAGSCRHEDETFPPVTGTRGQGMPCVSGADCAVGFVCCSRGCGQVALAGSPCGGTCESACGSPGGG